MADEADIASQITDDYNASALAAHFARVGPMKPGRHECADCGEPVSDLRRKGGAQLCIECEQDDQLRKRNRFHA